MTSLGIETIAELYLKRESIASIDKKTKELKAKTNGLDAKLEACKAHRVEQEQLLKGGMATSEEIKTVTQHEIKTSSLDDQIQAVRSDINKVLLPKIKKVILDYESQIKKIPAAFIKCETDITQDYVKDVKSIFLFQNTYLSKKVTDFGDLMATIFKNKAKDYEAAIDAFLKGDKTAFNKLYDKTKASLESKKHHNNVKAALDYFHLLKLQLKIVNEVLTWPDKGIGLSTSELQKRFDYCALLATQANKNLTNLNHRKAKVFKREYKSFTNIITRKVEFALKKYDEVTTNGLS